MSQRTLQKHTDALLGYAERVRRDHALFVSAFRDGRVGVRAVS